MSAMNRLYALIISVPLLLLVACAPPGPDVRPDPVDDRQAEAAELQARGEYIDAAQTWLELAEHHPERANRFRLHAAEALLEAGELNEAEDVLGVVSPDAADRAFEARFELARAELAMLRGDLGMAGWLLSHAAEDLPGGLVERHQALEDRLEMLEDQPARQALAALESAIAEDDFEPELALALLIEYPLEALEGIVYQYGHRSELLPWLDLVLSAREHLLDQPALRPALEAWQARHPQAGYSADEALVWLAAWRQSHPRPARVHVALPAPETPLYRPGNALRDGLVSAWLETPPDHRPELHFHYVGGNADDMVATWFDAREQGADLLIGPLDRNQVNALLELPDADMLPTLLLNLPDESTALEQAPGMTALALPPEEEAELAAARALVDGHQRAVVLAQYTSWGERVAGTFADNFELGGGRVLENRIYDAASTDHSHLLREVMRIDASEERARRLQRLIGESIESEPQRRTDLDMIFLAARADDGRLMPPQLRFFDAGDVPLMATSQIIAGAPDPGRDRDLDGVIVPIAPWFLDHTAAGRHRIQAERHHAHLGSATLSRLHALGRDAMSLVPWLVLMRSDPQLYLPGMTGRLSLPEGQVVVRDLPFIKLENGRGLPH
ncbi:penicillin-binding protein activator [Wenzhouxiangella sp. AB-CW3]|uniref:penicillin-binding protein activator n=1 Tax=Wenzhouxiangella sp. AB-CW3 TaxID=2771012 RepID=UPI00168A4C03|nr:penicillin-binding protein activator [Wenzhouxiangella sp. AB-CW3]QOC23420.1 penicillin-binding protein activator [Wenzhouxiangella sp. AB-CW3]